MSSSDGLERLSEAVIDAREQHFRLVWVAGGAAMERSHLLKAYADFTSSRYIEVGKSLSERLLELPVPQRAVSVQDTLSGLLANARDQITCLDHIEILFEPSLHVNAVEMVKSLSRYFLMVVAWPGHAEQQSLIFGPKGHPSSLAIPVTDLESSVLSI
jgi:hypothetical protein